MGSFDRCAYRINRPLRIFQFLATILMFSLCIYMAAMPFTYSTNITWLLLIILTSCYLFVMALDMISQFNVHGLPDSPMFLWSLLGVVLFAIAGSLLIHFDRKKKRLPLLAVTVVKALCFVISALFFIEVTILITYWKQKCINWKKCYPYTPPVHCTESDTRGYFVQELPQTRDPEIGIVDVTTSISNYKVPLDPEINDAVNQHIKRKINVGHRRQYVDTASSIPELPVVQITGIQTEHKQTVFTESQTQKTDTKETLVQTNSRCELCHREITDRVYSPLSLCVSDVPSKPPVIIEHRPRTIHKPESHRATQLRTPDCQTPRSRCVLAPALLQMMREEITNPCCQSCKCAVKHRAAPTICHTEHDSQRHQPTVSTPHRTQREPQYSQKSTSTNNPGESESPTTTKEKSDAERSDLLSEERNRYRPSKTIWRASEYRPCENYGAAQASGMATVPICVKETSPSSFNEKRNKRTQTLKPYDFSVSRTKGSPQVNETPKRRINDEKIEDNKKIYGYEILRKNRIRPKGGEITEKLPEDRVTLISDLEPQKSLTDSRRSQHGSSRKLYRNSESPSASNENVLSSKIGKMSDSDLSTRVATNKHETSSRMTGKRERSETRETRSSGNLEGWLGDKLPIKEEPDESIDLAFPSVYSTLEKIDEKEEKIGSSPTAVKKITEKDDASEIPIPITGPILRLRLKNPIDEPKSSKSSIERSRNTILKSPTSESIGSLRSIPEELPSMTEADISSKRSDDTNRSLGRRSYSDQTTNKLYRSPETKEDSESRSRSLRNFSGSSSDDKINLIDDEKSARLKDRTSDDGSPAQESEEIIDTTNSSTNEERLTTDRTKRTRSVNR